MKADEEQAAFSFEPLITDNPSLPPFDHYTARDNARLPYRKYVSALESAKKAVVLLHGSAWHSQQFFKLAPELTSVADVYALDLRGHGPETDSRGDVKYVGQLEDDLADFIQLLRSKRPNLRVTLLGHSSGGGLAVRFAGGAHNDLVDRYILVSPYISPIAPVTRRDQRWASASLPKLIGISLLDAFGIKNFNDQTVIRFNMPDEVRDGTETLTYSYRMLTSINPRLKYMKDIGRVHQPTLVIVGEEDEIFYPGKFKDLFGKLRNAKLKLIPGATHLSVMTDSKVADEIKNFIGSKRDH